MSPAVSQQKNMFSIFWLSYICCFPDFQTSKGFHGSLHSLELPLWGHQESVRCYRNCRLAHFEAVGDANCHSHCRERWSIHNTSLLFWLPRTFFPVLTLQITLNYYWTTLLLGLISKGMQSSNEVSFDKKNNNRRWESKVLSSNYITFFWHFWLWGFQKNGDIRRLPHLLFK